MDPNERIKKEEERLLRTMSKSQSTKRVSQTILTKTTNPEVTARANKFLKDEEIDVNDPSLEGKNEKRPSTTTKPVNVVITQTQVPVSQPITSKPEPPQQQQVPFVYRPDIVEFIHKMIRVKLFNVSKQLGSCDHNNLEKVKAAAGGIKQLTMELRMHADLENRLVFPAYEKRSPGATVQLHSEHDNQEKSYAELDALADGLLSNNDIKPKISTLYSKFNGFVAAYLLHMQEEELDLIPKVRSVMSDDEILNEITLPQIKALPFEKMRQGVELMYSSLNLDDKTNSCMTLKRALPTHVFDKVLKWIQGVVTPSDWKELNRRLFF